MNDENRINWNEVQAYLKAANVTETTKVGIYTNPMPQHQGGQVTTLGPTPVQTNPGPEASANIIRACTSKRDACETHRERGYDNSLLWSHFLCPQESKFQKQTKSLLNRTSSLPLNSLPGRGRGWKGVEGRMYPNECIGRWKWPLYLKSLRHLLVSQKAFGRLSFLFSHLTTVSHHVRMILWNPPTSILKNGLEKSRIKGFHGFC